MPRLTDSQRNQALGMHIAGWSARKISNHFDCSPSSIVRLLQRSNETGTVNVKNGCGRKKKTADHDDNAIVQQFHENPFTPTRYIANNFNVSQQTVRRRLKEQGLTCCKPYVGHVLSHG